jgi:GNAT superfamily N-acetyltransferase
MSGRRSSRTGDEDAEVTPIDIVHEEPTGDVAARLLQRYYQELDARLPGGFDLQRTVAVSEAELVAPHGAFLVVNLAGSPVGCGAVRKLDKTSAEIKRMWIDPAARGRGVGRCLLAALEEAARTLGCHTVRLDTSADLGEAMALYRSAGYRDIPPYNDNAYATSWFEKELT